MKAPFPAPTNEWHNASYASINPSRPELSAKGKKIVVTGGGYGIGRETAKSFALAGAAGIAITGRKEAPLLETKKFIESEYKVPVSTHVADITDVAAMKKAASEIGEWDVLVMNAGYMSTPGTTLGSDVDEWWKAFEINIKGSFITVQTLLPTKGKAPIIVGTSTAAVVLPASMITDGSSYVASKLGLIKFLEILAAEYPDVHITTIHPGIVETDMLSKSGMVGVPIDSVELPAHFTVWVASPEAAFLKGKFAYCNWDVDELKAKAQKIQETDVFTSGIMGNNPYSPDF